MNYWLGIGLVYLATFLYTLFLGQVNWHPYARSARKAIFNSALMLLTLWMLLAAALICSAVLIQTLSWLRAIFLIGPILAVHTLLVGHFNTTHTANYVGDLSLQKKRRDAEEMAAQGDLSAKFALYPTWIPAMHLLLAAFVFIIVFASKAENSHWLATLPAFILAASNIKDCLRRRSANRKANAGKTNALGFGQRIAKDGVQTETVFVATYVSDIAKAMANHYRQGCALKPDGDPSSICRDVVGTRYLLVPPSEKEGAIIRYGIETIQDFYDAVLLVVLAELVVSVNCEVDYDHDLDPALYRLCVETVAYKVAELDGIRNPENDTKVRRKMDDMFEKYAHIRTQAKLQDKGEV